MAEVSCSVIYSSLSSTLRPQRAHACNEIRFVERTSKARSLRKRLENEDIAREPASEKEEIRGNVRMAGALQNMYSCVTSGTFHVNADGGERGGDE